MDFLGRTRGLLAKLVAGKVQNLETLLVQAFVEALQVVVLRCETALGGGVHNQEDLAPIVRQAHELAIAIGYLKIIQALLSQQPRHKGTKGKERKQKTFHLI